MLNQMLNRTVSSYPQRDAIVCGETRITYHELGNQVLNCARGLNNLGVGETDCVALILPNCPEFIISFYAVSRLQGISLLLNPACKQQELAHYIEDSQAKVIITDKARAAVCQRLIEASDRQINLVVVGELVTRGVPFSSLLKEPLAHIQTATASEQNVIYQYTSGSTGQPKQVCRTQANLFYQARNCVATMEITQNDNIFCSIPLYHAYGLGECLLAATYSGAKLVILESCSPPEAATETALIFRRHRILQLIEQEAITILPSVPYLYSILASTPVDRNVDLSRLRLCISAGNFLAKDVFDRFLLRFGVPIQQLYGCTEAGSVAVNLSATSQERYNSVGLPMKNVHIAIIGNDETEVLPGIEGEIAIESQTLAPQYNTTSGERYYLTSDIGYKDRDGYIFITGRQKVFINAGGHKVDPLEIESVLSEHPAIKEVVVVGKSISQTVLEGEVVKAVIVIDGTCSETDIKSYCQDKLADFKIPRIFEFRTEIPKTSLGKIMRHTLV